MRGQRIESYVHTLRGVALWHLDQQSQKLPHHHAAVSFQRAQAVLRRPPSTGENFAFAVVIMQRAECHLSEIENSFADVERGYKEGDTPQQAGQTGGGETTSSAEASDGTEHSDRSDIASEVSAVSGIRRQLRIPRTLLQQARPSLMNGRLESRWRTFFDYLCARVHFIRYRLIRLTERDRILARNELHAALVHLVSALTSVPRGSDRFLVMRHFFQLVDDAGRETLGAEEWMNERRRCGLPEEPSPSGFESNELLLTFPFSGLHETLTTQGGTSEPATRDIERAIDLLGVEREAKVSKEEP